MEWIGRGYFLWMGFGDIVEIIRRGRTEETKRFTYPMFVENFIG